MNIKNKQTTSTAVSEASTEAVKAPEQTTNTAATEVSTTAADASQTEQTPAQNGEDITVKLTRSKTGLPCLWENGGGWSNTGNAQTATV